eukprot:CAMPEP_0204868022 /NCGR_PEP_ID=MMETSP1348-20121228/25310_1 /ASSEMBLY_ACC=CAM_ASM_000700 /TAXON_ID=215587 /ORGANISM="Aplanochytrium stocchinoi, Strain GSBS06" /LENGTH=328 /DNA_ID=CAMNT_0052020789 /DNA_START=457 /DNA_END=1443 /DNA_ORIENTATION=-
MCADFTDFAISFERIPQNLRTRLVSHRGFHSVHDELTRPIENTLEAYEYAWRTGTTFCECDIALTADKTLILCHDDSFRRLAADPESKVANTPVSELTLEELSLISLKDGAKVPTLEEVLDLCSRFEHAQLVIEIKSGGDAYGTELAETLGKFLFGLRKDLLSQVAVIMSFSLQTMLKMKQVSLKSNNDGKPLPKHLILTKVFPENESLQATADFAYTFDIEDEQELPCKLNQRQTEVEKNLIASGEHPLDGIYLQFQEKMLHNPVAQRWLENMSSKYNVGVWGRNTDPDNVHIGKVLVQLGVSYVNTDFPPNEKYHDPSHAIALSAI